MAALDKHLDQHKKKPDAGDADAKHAHSEVHQSRKEDDGKTNLGDPGLKVDKNNGTVDYTDSKWNHSVKAHVDKNGVNANVDGMIAQFDKATGQSHVDGKNLDAKSDSNGQYTVTDKKSGEELHWDNKGNSGFITDKSGNKIAEFTDKHDLKVWLKKNLSVDMVNGQGETAGSEADKARHDHKTVMRTFSLTSKATWPP